MQPFDESVVVLEIKGQQLHIVTKLLHVEDQVLRIRAGMRRLWLSLSSLFGSSVQKELIKDLAQALLGFPGF